MTLKYLCKEKVNTENKIVVFHHIIIFTYCTDSFLLDSMHRVLQYIWKRNKLQYMRKWDIVPTISSRKDLIDMPCQPYTNIASSRVRSPQAKSKIFNSFQNWFLPQHFRKWLSPTDHFFVDFHSNLRTSNYDVRA